MTRASRIVGAAAALFLLGFSGRDDAPAVDLDTLITLIATVDDPPTQLDLLRGAADALGGRRRVAMPAAWREAYATLARSSSPDVRDAATRLALVFGDPAAFESLRRLAADPKAPVPRRVDAIESLARARDESLARVLHGLIADHAVRAAALRGLAATDDPGTPALILQAFAQLSPDERADAVATLASRPSYALALFDAVGRGVVTPRDIPASTLQALGSHRDPAVAAGFARVFGVARETPAAKTEQIGRFKSALTSDRLAHADRSRGRVVFARTCASCHVLFDAGGKIGPELTGSQRANLDYVLTNVVDPSAIVGRDYQVSVFETTDGRVVSGIVKREDDRSVAVQTANDLVILPKTEIESRRTTGASMMPEGLLNPLKESEVADLIAYLASPAQVPLPPPGGGGR